MRIVLAHNYYRSSAPSGESQVFEAEQASLRSHGHLVATFTRHSDELVTRSGPLRGALVTPWNPFAAAELRRLVTEFRPDVVHVHNTFPLLSPAIFHAVAGHAACVLTLHNYRLFCAAGVALRAGRPCTACLDRHSVLPALRYGCYRGSRIATAPLAASIWLHRWLGTWERHVDAFVSATEFQRELMAGAGLPVNRLYVKPNFCPGDPSPVPWEERGEYAVFSARLTPEKGGPTLLRAWTRWGAAAPELRVLGDGPEREALQRLGAAGGARVVFLGQLSRAAADRQVASAKLMVIPSECLEVGPRVLAEAFAHGTPVAASKLGALPSLVRDGTNGLLFAAGDPGALLDAVRRAWTTPGLLERLSRGARATFAAELDDEANHRRLLEIYQRAIAHARRPRA